MSVLKDNMSEWLIPLVQKDSDDLFCLGARRYFTALSTRWIGRAAGINLPLLISPLQSPVLFLLCDFFLKGNVKIYSL